MYDSRNRTNKSVIELFNIFRSLCSIIALLIVLCAQLQLTKMIVIIGALMMTIGLTGWLFVLGYRVYAEKIWGADEDIHFAISLLLGVIGLVMGLIIFVYGFKLCFLLTDWLVSLIADTVTSIT